MLNLLNISASALSAGQLDVSVEADNLANMDTVNNGTPYQDQVVIMQARAAATTGPNQGIGQGVQVSAVVPSQSPPTTVYDPQSPLANAQGNVLYPNVHLTTAMPDLIQATSFYTANATAFTDSKNLDQTALKL